MINPLNKEKLLEGCGYQDNDLKSSLCKKDNLCSDCLNNLYYFNQGQLSKMEDEIKFLELIFDRYDIRNEFMRSDFENRIKQLNQEIEEIKKTI